MKNNFITKIIGATLAFAMMIGGAVGINTSKQAKEVNADSGDTYNRVMSANDISSGDTIIIVSQDGTKAMSTTQNGNNRGFTAVTSADDVITIPNNSSIQELVVYAGATNGQFGFYTGSGFLYGVNNQNYLRTTSDNSPASSDVTGTSAWTISANNSGVFSIANASAQKNSNYVYIAWNNSNSIFSAYGTGQQKPYIYKKAASSEQVNTVSASIKSGTYYAGTTLSETDFEVVVTWTGGKDNTEPSSGFTWTVNGVANGRLAIGQNNIVVTYQGVSSAVVVLSAIRDPRWSTELSVTLINDIDIPGSGDTNEKYFVAAKIIEITNDKYGNANAIDEDGTEFVVYGTYNYNGTVRYDSMNADEKPVAGDIVVIQGVLTIYEEKPEMKNARVMQRNGTTFQDEELTDILLSESTLELDIGEHRTLTVSPQPVNAALGDVEWSTSNEAIATVDNGTVTAVAPGTATITATAGTFSKTCSVTVNAPSDVLSVATSISVGDVVIMTANGVSNQYVGPSGAANSAYGVGESFSIKPDSSKLSLLVVAGAEDNTFAFMLRSGDYENKYISWVSGNALTTSEEINENSSWIVEIDNNGNATIKNFSDNERIIWWNVSNPRFACYTSKSNGNSYKYTQLWKLVSPEICASVSTTIKTISGVESNEGAVVEQVALRFGAIITINNWTGVNETWPISEYGVIFARQSMLTARGLSSAEAVFRNDAEDVGRVYNNSGSHPKANGDNYVFTARLNLEEADYDEVFYAVPYFVAGGEHYFLKEEHYSVRTLAVECLTSGESSLSQAALTTLKGNN